MTESNNPLIDSAPELVVVKYYLEDVVLTASYPKYSFDALSEEDQKIYEGAFMRYLDAVLRNLEFDKTDALIVTSLDGVSITLEMPGEPLLELTNISGDFFLFGSEQDVEEYKRRMNNQ
jgi:hypothetical protein